MFKLRVIFYMFLWFQLSTSTERNMYRSTGEPKNQGGVENAASLGKQTDVIVIGCGAAGVAAMRKLHDAGLNAIGLEAAGAIGGRISVTEFADSTVDLGAYWVVGEVNNSITEMAAPYDLLGEPPAREHFYVLSNGELVSNSKSRDMMNAFSQQVQNADKTKVQSIAECARSAIDTNPVLKSDQKLAKYFVNLYERLNHLGVQVNPKHDKSLRCLAEHSTPAGRMLAWKGRGYTGILDLLMNKYPDPSKEVPLQILLNKEVKSIQWKNNTGSDQLVRVDCKDGSSYSAKSVIVTVSIGVLKDRHAELFNPPLPSNKVTVIDTLQMLVIEKIYVEVDTPWWDKPTTYYLLWTDEEKATFSAEDKWVTEISSIDTVSYNTKALLFWMIGKGAEVMENVSQERLEAGINKLLNEVLKKKFNVSTVKKVLRTQWAADPLNRGAYAYRSVETEEKGGDGALTLSEPLYSGSEFPVLCFAGEATSPDHHWDAHGAVDTGFREADRLIKSFKTLKA